jgi:hypothetical protein
MPEPRFSNPPGVPVLSPEQAPLVWWAYRNELAMWQMREEALEMLRKCEEEFLKAVVRQGRPVEFETGTLPGVLWLPWLAGSNALLFEFGIGLGQGQGTNPRTGER